LEQRLNDSTASGEHRTFYFHFSISRNEVCLNEWHVRTECSSTLASCEFAAPPIYTTGMITPTWPTNPGLNFESNLNTPLNLLNHAVRDGGLNAGTNTTSDAHGGTPKQQVSFDNAGGSGSFATTRSVDQGMFSHLSPKVLIFETVLPQRSLGFKQEGATPYHPVPLFVHQTVTIQTGKEVELANPERTPSCQP
jgi:hypothetical protein